MVAVVVVLTQVRIAPLTICVGVNLPTGGRPFSPCGPVAPLAPLGPAAPVAPFAPAAPAGPVAPFAPGGPAGPVAPLDPGGPCDPVWLHEIGVSLGKQLSVAGSITRS